MTFEVISKDKVKPYRADRVMVQLRQQPGTAPILVNKRIVLECFFSTVCIALIAAEQAKT